MTQERDINNNNDEDEEEQSRSGGVETDRRDKNFMIIRDFMINRSTQSRSGDINNFMNSPINAIRKLGIWKRNKTEITCRMGLDLERGRRIRLR